jgi:hypothetical protein
MAAEDVYASDMGLDDEAYGARQREKEPYPVVLGDSHRAPPATLGIVGPEFGRLLNLSPPLTVCGGIPYPQLSLHVPPPKSIHWPILCLSVPHRRTQGHCIQQCQYVNCGGA